MNTLGKRIWREDQGVLTFEWILLITLLVIGIVGGLSAVRDAVIDELGDVAGAAVRIDQSYTVVSEECGRPHAEPLGKAFGYRDSLPSKSPARSRAEADPNSNRVASGDSH